MALLNILVELLQKTVSAGRLGLDGGTVGDETGWCLVLQGSNEKLLLLSWRDSPPERRSRKTTLLLYRTFASLIISPASQEVPQPDSEAKSPASQESVQLVWNGARWIQPSKKILTLTTFNRFQIPDKLIEDKLNTSEGWFHSPWPASRILWAFF